MATQKRNDFLDVARGAAIVLMIFGHAIQNGNGEAFISSGDFWTNPVVQWIYTFHMPLFMLISGYLAYFSQQKYNLSHLIKHKIVQFAPPIILFATYSYIIFTFSDPNLSFSWKDYIFRVITAYWFLSGIMISSILISIVNKIFRDSWQINVLIIVIFLFMPLFGRLKMLPFIYPFFVLAYYFSQYREKFLPKIQHNFWKITAIATWIFLLLGIFFTKTDYIYISGFNIFYSGVNFSAWHQLRVDVYRIAVGCAGSVAFLMMLYAAYTSHRISGRFWNLLIYFGKNSLGIYCIQEIIIVEVFAKLHFMADAQLNYGTNLLQSIVILVLACAIIELLKLNPIVRKYHLE